MLLHDVFRFWELLPGVLVGSTALKALAIGFLIVLIRVSGREAIGQLIHRLLYSPYWLLVPAFFVPAIFDFPWPSYRMLPFYPFVFVVLARWFSVWIKTAGMRRSVAGVALVAFLAGNPGSWIRATVISPRGDYVRMKTIAQKIHTDLYARRIDRYSFSVHYYTSIDTTDYFASPLWYLLRLSEDYRVPFVSKGNDVDRTQYEKREYAYLVCTYMTEDDVHTMCVTPFLIKTAGYAVVDLVPVSGDTMIVVFHHSPLEDR